jgi:hypothetical protein
MEPFLKYYYNLKSLISDIKIEIVLDDYIHRNDEYGPDPDDNNYDPEGTFTIREYDIIINGIYHYDYVNQLIAAFGDFNVEIKDNLKSDLFKDSIPSYLKKLTEELTIWFENISELELKLNSQSKWIYISKKIDQSFLKPEVLNNKILETISNFFQYIKNSAVATLENIKKFQNEVSGEKEIVNSEGMFSEIKKPTNPADALDIYQTALLFHYLKKHHGIYPHVAASLAKIVSILTGHSEQNLRTDKGFGVIANIQADRAKNQNFNNVPDYNLITVKGFLQAIVEDIDKQIKKNNPI